MGRGSRQLGSPLGATRFAGTFYWVTESRYSANRKENLLSALSVGMQPVMQWRSQVQAYARMNSAEYRKRNITVPSPADCLLIAYGITISEVRGKRATVVSDDAGVRFTVEELDLCDTWSGYQLVKRLTAAKLRPTTVAMRRMGMRARRSCSMRSANWLSIVFRVRSGRELRSPRASLPPCS